MKGIFFGGKMKNENYITIQGWMRKELGLSGNELLAYALVYGFSQDGESTFRGSLSYVAEWLGCSKQTAITTLRKLVEKGLIERIEEPINGILFVRYRILSGGQNSLIGESKNLTTPSQNFLPNNNSINNQEDKKENKKENNKFTPPTVDEIEEFCKERNNGVDAKRVYDYYSSANWKDSKGNPIRSWKQKIIAVWEKPKENVKAVGKVAHDPKDYEQDFNADGTFKW